MTPVYLHDWSAPSWGSDVGLPAMQRDFAISDARLDGVEVLLAAYSYADYEGQAYVLFRKEGQLFEVHGGHCSCYGLEGQWDPQAVTKNDLLLHLNAERVPYEYHWVADELRAVLKRVRKG